MYPPRPEVQITRRNATRAHFVVMDTGRVLDIEALSQGCKQCERHEHLYKASLEYQTWRAEHTKCKANFRGSAPAMEPEGADRIFRRSVQKHNLRYTEFYGDGDSKSFTRVKGVYEDDGIEMEKKEWNALVMSRREWELHFVN